jgi:glycosyltransferase 2 family protein
MTKRLAINLGLSFTMLAVCVYLVWPSPESRVLLAEAVRKMRWADFWPYLLAYGGLMVVVHFCRSWRWNNLLAPLGVRLGFGRLFAISSVGFLAILALPARLGEFVRPTLIRKKGEISASAALGTVAVERVIDGLFVSVFVFGALFSLRGPDAPGWMMPTAYAALGVFLAALVFLLFAMRKPEATVDFCLKMSLMNRFAPRAAAVIREKLLEMIRGLAVLRDVKNMLAFAVWTILYWTANGMTVLVMAHAFGLPLTPIGAYASMGVVAVGIMLPNAPAIAGQFQYFTLLGLSLYLGADILQDDPPSDLYIKAMLMATVHYLLQVAWYVSMGLIGLASRHVAWADLRSKKTGPTEEPG